MSDKCTLHDKEWNQCCCNCQFHKPTHEHCTTNMFLRDQIAKKTGIDTCICSIRNGWACCGPDDERIYTNWPEHSVGCEMYQAKPKVLEGGAE